MFVDERYAVPECVVGQRPASSSDSAAERYLLVPRIESRHPSRAHAARVAETPWGDLRAGVVAKIALRTMLSAIVNDPVGKSCRGNLPMRSHSTHTARAFMPCEYYGSQFLRPTPRFETTYRKGQMTVEVSRLPARFHGPSTNL